MKESACARVQTLNCERKVSEVERDSSSERGENCPFPLPNCRTIRHNPPIIPLLSGSMGRATRFAIVLLLYAVALPVHAATITVTNTNDSGPGSLRQALNDRE